jgi:hypothetical protein
MRQDQERICQVKSSQKHLFPQRQTIQVYILHATEFYEYHN